MGRRDPRERFCSYVVPLPADFSADDLRELAHYLSGLAECDVVVLDRSTPDAFESNARTLRWVARHIAVKEADVLHAATALAAPDKIIVASAEVRYTPEALGSICELLDQHEAVEPQGFVEPWTWWGGIEAGRILIHRGVEPHLCRGETFGFRRVAFRNLGGTTSRLPVMSEVDRLINCGAEVFHATTVFVSRRPGDLRGWLASRVSAATEEFSLPGRAMFFLAVMPVLVLLSVLGGFAPAATVAGVLAFASAALALRGRHGATRFFPLQACLFAPLWLFERAFMVYVALARTWSGRSVIPARRAIVTPHAGAAPPDPSVSRHRS